MIYKAITNNKDSFLSLPESGMGYQIIEAKKQGQTYKDKFIVYNSELIVDLDTSFNLKRNKIESKGYRMMFSSSYSIRLSDISIASPIIQLQLSTRQLFSAIKTETKNKGRHTGGKGAVDNDEIYAKGTDVFARLSAYESDNRIDTVNNRLLPGSYTTSHKDYSSCKSHNDDPVDRFALPNDEEIKWAFYIIRKSYDKYRPGVVQPANGHEGGGIEALFDNRTANGTFIRKDEY